MGWECAHGEDVRANFNIDELLHPSIDEPRQPQRRSVQTADNDIELVENGRIEGLIRKLQAIP
jgi:hypothetical protein